MKTSRRRFIAGAAAFAGAMPGVKASGRKLDCAALKRG